MVCINVFGNKFKSMLTSLGIIVGTATIVLVIAIGQGGQAEVAEQYANLNAGAIDVSYERNSENIPGSERRSGSSGSSGSFGGFGGPGGGSFSGSFGGSSGGSGSANGMPDFGSMPGDFGGGSGRERKLNSERLRLDEDDMNEILNYVPDISSASIVAESSSEVTGGNLEDAAEYTVVGVDSSYQDISNLTMLIGTFITEDDDADASKVCVLGYDLANEIFGSAQAAYDSIIYINGRSFTVCGVLQSMSSVTSGITPDTTIYLPFDSAEKYVIGSTEMNPKITVVASDISKVDEIISNIQSVLQDSHPNATFTITDAGSTMEAATSSADTLALLLLAVASIVFIVGGIGIMNVLLFSVKERTKEIGILKAIGTAKKDILISFLIESNLISLFGGLVGIGISFALLPIIQNFGMRVETSVEGWLLAIVFAIVTGTVFGVYPAAKAANLSPIEALNDE